MSEEKPKTKLKFHSELVKNCIFCNSEFENMQPESDSDGKIHCPEEEGGCGAIYKIMVYER